MMRMYRQAVVCVNKNIYHDLRHRKMIRTYDIYHDMGVFIDLCSNSTNAIQCYMKITNKIP